jgi:hypothetical protein
VLAGFLVARRGWGYRGGVLGRRGRRVHLPIRLGTQVLPERQAEGTDLKGHTKRQRTGTVDLPAVQHDKTLVADRREAPGPASPGKAASLRGELLVGQAHLAERGPADPDRNPGQLHDANRTRLTILDVETRGLRHDEIDSSLSLDCRGSFILARRTDRCRRPATGSRYRRVRWPISPPRAARRSSASETID